jgi:hypothetical protein
MKDKLIQKIKSKFHKALLCTEKKFNHIEIKNFSYSSIEDSVLLIRDIVSKLDSLHNFEEYSFDYYFLIRTLNEPFPIGFLIRFGLKGEEVRFYSVAVQSFYTDLRLNGLYALFLGLYFGDLETEWEEENSREIIINTLEKISIEKGLNFQLYFGSPGIDDFIEDSFAFEIPVVADIVEYIV